MKTNTNPEQMTAAQLYWDDQDPKNAGWWLRYTDATGTEQGTAIDATEDASVEELAAVVEAESHWIGLGTIKVLRGDQPRGTITVSDGAISWSAS
jgi:hypothetical protein